ncbi:MAG TPA: sirohydrochlorin chelatase [Jiangellaceae bacterium]
MTAPPVLVAVAHGTRDPAGPVVLARLLDDVRARLPGVEVRVAYVDVIGPTLDEVLAATPRAVVVPMFLASGYHVRVDVPEVVARSDSDAVVTAPLGPDALVVGAVADRLRAASGLGAAGGLNGLPEAVVLAAAGSSDQRALADVEAAGQRLAAQLERPVTIGYVTTAAPTVAQAVEAHRRAGRGRVAIASYLLAPGLFQSRLDDAGADVVAGPIGAHPMIAELIVARYRSA